MVIAKILIDRLAPAEALLDTVPELNRRLAQPPAQIYLGSAKQRREIDEPDVEVLHQATELLNAQRERARRQADRETDEL